MTCAIISGSMQRLVALHVDDDVARQVGGDFGDAIGAGAVRRRASSARCRRTLARAAAIALVIGGHDHRVDAARGRGAAIDVLDHRPAGDIGERFARKRVES